MIANVRRFRERTMRAIALLLVWLASFTANAGSSITVEDSARIVRSAKRLVESKPTDWTFAVVTETASGKFVQFAAEDRAITFDFPVLAASVPNVPGPLRDANCSTSKPVPKQGEVEQRRRPEEEVSRLTRFLSANRLLWKTRYCQSLTSNDRRVGYSMSIIGTLESERIVPEFVEGVFREVYLIRDIRGIAIETDE
jgi:hypothetical protein